MPLGEGGGAIALEVLAAVKVALLVVCQYHPNDRNHDRHYSYRDADGIIKDAKTGVGVDPTEDVNIRGKLKFMISDNVTLDLRGYYNDMSAGAAYYVAVDGNGFAGDPCCTPPQSDVIGYSEREMWDASAKLDWETGKVINPAAVAGQIQGSVIQGLGLVLVW